LVIGRTLAASAAGSHLTGAGDVVRSAPNFSAGGPVCDRFWGLRRRPESSLCARQRFDAN